MRRNTFRWRMGGLATILAVVICSPVVQGGYTPPSRSSSLLGEVSAFVGDFGAWNASLNNRPLQFLASAPAAEQIDVFVALFWLWLQDAGTGSSANASPLLPSPKTLAGLVSPPSSGAPIGSIVMGQPGEELPSLLSNAGNGPSSVLSNGGGGDPPPVLSNGGSNPVSPIPIGGDDPPAIGSNGGSSSLRSDPPSPLGGSGSFSSGPPSTTSGGSSGQSLGSGPPLGSSAGDSGESPFAPGATDPVPEPASFMLLAVGAGGLLIGRRMRQRHLA